MGPTGCATEHEGVAANTLAQRAQQSMHEARRTLLEYCDLSADPTSDVTQRSLYAAMGQKLPPLLKDDKPSLYYSVGLMTDEDVDEALSMIIEAVRERKSGHGKQ